MGFGVELGCGVGVIVCLGLLGFFRDGFQSRYGLAATTESDSDPALAAGTGP
ncbi:hypothetical protein GCM10027569_14210 [Flindersiella endophytica]